MSTPESITSELQKLAPSAVIEVFEVDATALGADVLRFHAGTNGLNQDLVWQGETYVAYPIEATGFDITGQGQFPRPRLKVSNYLSALTAYLRAYEDLIGAKFTRKRTLVKYLDAVNFPGGVNPSADPLAEFPDDVYFIDRKVVETKTIVEFELASSIDLAGVRLPKRQIIQNLCGWVYRGAECGYSGGLFFDRNDNAITTGSTPEAQAVIDAGIAYNTKYQELILAERALAQAQANKNTQCDALLNTTLYSSNFPWNVGPKSFVRMNADRTVVLDARYNGTPVTLGNTYRQGEFVENKQSGSIPTGPFYAFFRIEFWQTNAGACSTATTAYNSALSARNTKKAETDSAKADFDAAFASLDPSDPIFKLDRCGKRLSSCKIRFGRALELPFGGFPGAGLVG